jgi:DNA-binding response OmpR family regulator
MQGMEGQAQILLVEDHPDVADLYVLKLQLEGYRVAVAHDGLTGLEMARSLDPDIALIDAHLPGLAGLHLLAALRASHLTRKLPVIMFSEDDSRELIIEAERLEAAAYLIKANLLPSTLARIVRDVLGERSGTPASLESPVAKQAS